VWIANSNAEVFGADADVFRPERWLEDAEAATVMDRNLLSVRDLHHDKTTPRVKANDSHVVWRRFENVHWQEYFYPRDFETGSGDCEAV
jgi:hypothetical protein